MAQVRELLEQVKARIMADPGTYNQNTFCGTVCCIAGQIDIVVNGAEIHSRRTNERIEDVRAIEQTALAALGEDEDIWLFAQPDTEPADDEYLSDFDSDLHNYWPIDLSVEYNDAVTPLARAAVGCKAIDRYLAERGL